MTQTRLLAGFLLALLAPVAIAQTATVAVTHDDPDGLIEPGQVVRIDVNVTWREQRMTFAGLKGDARATPNFGTASNHTSIFPQGALINWGQAVGGGIVGADFAVTLNFGLWCYPWPPSSLGTALIGPILSFDWTAPTDAPGPVTFSFATPAAAPKVRLYATSASPNFSEAQTTFIPVTVTVVPAPAGLWLTPLLALPRRRRHHR